jgi:hypothetical protein
VQTTAPYAKLALWGFVCTALSLPVLPCDGEWHKNGNYREWSGISFSESNNPDALIQKEIQIQEARKQMPKKNKRRKAKKVRIEADSEDLGFTEKSQRHQP